MATADQTIREWCDYFWSKTSLPRRNAVPVLPTDIEHAIRDLVHHTQDAARTGSPTAHSLASVAKVSLETIIASHLRNYAEMKAALEAQTSGM